jgi:hypothetical protein
MFLFDYLSWEPIDVLTAFRKDAEPMMTIKDSSIGTNLERALLTGC